VPRNEAIECLLKTYALNPAYLELSQYPELSFTIDTKRLFEMRPRERKEEDRPEIYRKQDMRYLYAEPVFVPEKGTFWTWLFRANEISYGVEVDEKGTWFRHGIFEDGVFTSGVSAND